MAGPKGSKYYDVFIKYNISMAKKGEDEVINELVFILLNYINKYSSIKSASEKLNISYRKAWGDIKKAEEMLGIKLIVSERGGINRGKTYLTNDGEELIFSYKKLIKEINDSSSRIIKDFFNTINKNN